MRTALRSAILLGAAALAACSDVDRPTRPIDSAPPPIAQSLHHEFTIHNRRTGEVFHLVLDGSRLTGYRNGERVAELRNDSLITYRGGRSFAHRLPAGATRPRGRTPSVSLDEYGGDDGDWVADDDGGDCSEELAKLIAAASAFATAVDVAVAAEVATAGGATPVMVIAVGGTGFAYGYAVYKYNKCMKSPSTSAVPAAA